MTKCCSDPKGQPVLFGGFIVLPVALFLMLVSALRFFAPWPKEPVWVTWLLAFCLLLCIAAGIVIYQRYLRSGFLTTEEARHKPTLAGVISAILVAVFVFLLWRSALGFVVLNALFGIYVFRMGFMLRLPSHTVVGLAYVVSAPLALFFLSPSTMNAGGFLLTGLGLLTCALTEQGAAAKRGGMWWGGGTTRVSSVAS